MKPMQEVRVALWTGAANNLVAVENSLQRLGCQVKRVVAIADLRPLIENDLDLVVATCQSAAEVLDWMKGVRRAGQPTPPVLTLATGFDVEKYLQAMNLGAFDCVALPVQERELHRLVCRAIEEPRAELLLLQA